jgi:ABC-type transporter Mla subunit MlaD
MTQERQRRVRLLAVVALAVAAIVLLTVLLTSGGTNPYRVRAIFDSAANVIPGEDVKVAGVKVGAISSLQVVNNRYAAIVLQIDDPDFQDFRVDARCSIRLQSLIGEKFVDCTPTATRTGGSPPPDLPKVPAGQEGAGEHYLPLSHTSSPVDPDLIQNISRMPAPERLRVILNELGTALGGRGDDLHDAVRRADPALRETDRVLAIIASQNTTLAQLAADSDRALAPVANDTAAVTGTFGSIAKTATATAERRAALALDIQKFPEFLRQLTPTVDRLGNLADAATPVLNNLNRAAPGLNEFSVGLKPFAEAALPWFQSLGATAEKGKTDVVQSQRAIDALTNLATKGGPEVQQLGGLLSSLDKNQLTRNFMNLIFFGASATNGYDGISHYLRTAGVVPPCSFQSMTPVSGCLGTFGVTNVESRSVARALTATPTNSVANKAGGAPLPSAAGHDTALLDYLLKP